MFIFKVDQFKIIISHISPLKIFPIAGLFSLLLKLKDERKYDMFPPPTKCSPAQLHASHMSIFNYLSTWVELLPTKPTNIFPKHQDVTTQSILMTLRRKYFAENVFSLTRH